jgi:two-component sensor histidine kinase
MDSTDRKLAEEQIKASLKEKETLLLEIHHRVKNNMQVISSLLKLQSNAIKDDRIKKTLLESQNRVKAMATVHENLYKSKNLSSISISPFLKELAESILKSYQLSSEDIVLEIDSDEIFISIEQASPLGLIVNELVSNSLKYAFPDERHGKIGITVNRLKNELIHLRFSDNGVGIPVSLDWRNTDSLGLKLVLNLAENQLDGSIKMEIDNGTNYDITFKEDHKLKG